MSEIVDGNFKDKVVELYNPSDSIKDLTGYHLRIFKNGSPTPDIIPLSGTIAAKETYVVTHPQANSTILSKADLTDIKMNFTGSDAIVLRKGISTDIDKIGEIGIVSGANGWALLPTGNTKDSDIRRKYPIDKGETDWNNGKQQWTVHPKDSIQDVKQHNNVCNQPTTPTCVELFISEYLDGNQKDKAIEVFNPTESAIDLTDYALQVFQNGAPTPINIPLQGSINPKETYVVTHPQANSTLLSKADLTSVNLNFDGNDAIVLKKGTSTYVDKIGEIAINPGANGWQIPPSATTKDVNLRRKFPIDNGETDWNQGKNQWDVHPKDSIQSIKQHQNICSFVPPNVDIFYRFQNPLLLDSSDGNSYFQFDIYVKASNDSSYFRSTNLWFRYDTLAFGSDIVIYSKVTAKRLPPFDDTTYSGMQNMIVFVPNQDDAFQLTVSQNYNYAPNKVNLTNSLIPFVRIFIRAPNCDNYSNIEYFNLYSPIVQSHFTIPGDTTGNLYPYNSESFENMLDVQLPCDSGNLFWIADFFPKRISAGTNSILTITGTGFGNSREDGQVMFKNSNDWGNTYISSLDFNDYVSWDNTQIEIRLPSLVDTLSSPNNILTPGNGIFYVKNSVGDTISSNDSLHIWYARFTAPIGFPVYKRKSFLATTDISDSATIVFYLDTSISNNGLILAIVKKAMVDWRCATGVNFIIGGTVQNQNFTDDSISIIFLDNNLNGSPVAQTLPSGKICGTSLVIDGADIRISRDLNDFGATWNFDTTISAVPLNQIDFYEVILHELGHAHGLLHVLDLTEVMYTGHLSGPIPLADKITFDPGATYNSVNSREGADSIAKESISIPVCAGIDAIFIPLNYACTDPVRIEYFNSNSEKTNVFPNPFTEDISIHYFSLNNETIHITIHDIFGRILLEKKVTKPQNLLNEINLDLVHFSNGIYLLNMRIDNKLNSFKIIKL